MAALEITIWDVNHGSAVHISTPNGRHIVVDLGDAEDFSPLKELKARGIPYLDAVFVTHPHRDHLDDIFNFRLLSPQVFYRPRHLSVDQITVGNRPQDLPVIRKYLEIDNNFNAPIPQGQNLAAPANFGGVTFQCFSPRLSPTSNLNNHSLVVVVEYAGLKMILPGDNEATSWNELLASPQFVAAVRGADVFLASHHGREAGYSSELFEAMGKPKLIVISDGRFGETSATGRYSNQATGWTVFDSSGTCDTRKCVTTRSDGHITIKLGWSAPNSTYRNFINVTTGKVNQAALIRRFLGGVK